MRVPPSVFRAQLAYFASVVANDPVQTSRNHLSLRFFVGIRIDRSSQSRQRQPWPGFPAIRRYHRNVCTKNWRLVWKNSFFSVIFSNGESSYLQSLQNVPYDFKVVTIHGMGEN
jgi:hypothetical protein